MNILYEVMSTNSDKYQNIRLLYPPLYIYIRMQKIVNGDLRTINDSCAKRP